MKNHCKNNETILLSNTHKWVFFKYLLQPCKKTSLWLVKLRLEKYINKSSGLGISAVCF